MTDPIQPLTPEQITHNEDSAKHEGYFHKVIEEVDVLANVIAGGPQDDTISTRLGRDAVEDHGIGEEVGKIGSKLLGDIQKDHVVKASYADEVRGNEEAQRNVQEQQIINEQK